MLSLSADASRSANIAVESLEEKKARLDDAKRERAAALVKHYQWKRITMPLRAPPEHLPPERRRHSSSTYTAFTSSGKVLDALRAGGQREANHNSDSGSSGQEKKEQPAAPIMMSTTTSSGNSRPPPNPGLDTYPVYRWMRQRRAQREKEASKWNPHTDPNIVTDPSCTVFVGRLNKRTTTEASLRAHCEQYGRVKTVRVVVGGERRCNPNSNDCSGSGEEEEDDGNEWAPSASEVGGRSCHRRHRGGGYGFVEYYRQREAANAVRYGNGSVLDGKEILVDIERGRTSSSFRPMRLRHPSERQHQTSQRGGGEGGGWNRKRGRSDGAAASAV